MGGSSGGVALCSSLFHVLTQLRAALRCPDPGQVTSLWSRNQVPSQPLEVPASKMAQPSPRGARPDVAQKASSGQLVGLELPAGISPPPFSL